MHQIKKKTHQSKGTETGIPFTVPQCRNSITTLDLGRWIVVQQRRKGREKSLHQEEVPTWQEKAIL